jgi:YVTN family beta-propeller protein
MVSVFDVFTGKLVAEIKVGDEPSGLAITPDGSLLYVANSLSNTVSVIDTAVNRVVRTLPVGGKPTSIIASQNNQNMYLVNSGVGEVIIIDQISQRITKSFKVGRSPRHGIAVIHGESGDFLYVTNFGDNSITAIEVATGRVNTVNVGSAPIGIVAAPDGRRLYVVSSGNASVLVFEFSNP